MDMKGAIEYAYIEPENMDVIKPLWEKLNCHHKSRSRNFKDYFDKLSYVERAKRITERAAGGAVHILLAKDARTGAFVGYCISVVDSGGAGEVESIFVDEVYRGYGIGEEFMTDALKWFETMKASEVRLVVAEGNEEVFEFYCKFGFYHKSSVLVRKN